MSSTKPKVHNTEEDWTMTTGNMHNNFGKLRHVVTADIQTF